MKEHVVASCLAQGGLLTEIKGEPYCVVPCDGLGHWVYRCTDGSTEYFVNAALTYCTCPDHGRKGGRADCKHLSAVRHLALEAPRGRS